MTNLASNLSSLIKPVFLLLDAIQTQVPTFQNKSFVIQVDKNPHTNRFYNIERIAGPNCTKRHTALCMAPKKMHAKCEDDKINVSWDMCSTFRKHLWIHKLYDQWHRTCIGYQNIDYIYTFIDVAIQQTTICKLLFYVAFFAGGFWPQQ